MKHNSLIEVIFLMAWGILFAWLEVIGWLPPTASGLPKEVVSE